MDILKFEPGIASPASLTVGWLEYSMLVFVSRVRISMSDSVVSLWYVKTPATAPGWPCTRARTLIERYSTVDGPYTISPAS